jgi:hypothetical protein
MDFSTETYVTQSEQVEQVGYDARYGQRMEILGIANKGLERGCQRFTETLKSFIIT